MEKVLAEEWVKIEFEGRQYRFYIGKPWTNTYGLPSPHKCCFVSIKELKTGKFLFWKYKYWSEIGPKTSVKIDYRDYIYFESNDCPKFYFNPRKAFEIFRNALYDIKEEKINQIKKMEEQRKIKIVNCLKVE